MLSSIALSAPRRQRLSFDRIDTPLQAALTPLLSPSLINYAVNSGGNAQARIQGQVSSGAQQYSYDLQLQVSNVARRDDEQTNVSGSLRGTFAGLDTQIDLDQSGVNVTEKGHIGQNAVDLTNHYSVWNDNVHTTGKIGGVDVDVTTDANGSAGHIGDAKLSETIQLLSDSLDVSGTLGTEAINGRIFMQDNRTQVLRENIGAASVYETITHA